jgi:hypothetical protein
LSDINPSCPNIGTLAHTVDISAPYHIIRISEKALVAKLEKLARSMFALAIFCFQWDAFPLDRTHGIILQDTVHRFIHTICSASASSLKHIDITRAA